MTDYKALYYRLLYFCGAAGGVPSCSDRADVAEIALAGFFIRDGQKLEDRAFIERQLHRSAKYFE